MPAFREGDYPALTIEVEDGPDITMSFGFVDYEEAAIHFQIEGLDLPVEEWGRGFVIERDALIMAIIQGWVGNSPMFMLTLHQKKN